MPIINALLPELDHEAKSTIRVLERIPAEHLGWTPHAKSTPLGRLAWHVASLPKNVANMVRAGVFDVANARPPHVPENPGEIVEEFKRNHAATREYLATLSDEFLHEPFTMKRGETTVLTMPKVAVIRNILMNHTYHHRGQLTVYLRLLEIPLPAVYGTSADEPM
jgi:uncharacterized damage-inducible protein DinB